MYSEDDLLPLSAIQHYAFCKRQWALIHLERQWDENVRTVEGRILHERVHDPEYHESRGGVIFARSLPLKSFQLGLVGVADLVEFHPLDIRERNGIPIPGQQGLYQAIPIEYKRGRPKPDDRDAVQLCAQAMCLEEMFGIRIQKGYLFYGQTQHREKVEFEPQLRALVKDLSRKMHVSVEEGETPPAQKGVKCSLCSLENVCLPQLTRKRKPVYDYIKEHLKE